MWTAGALNEKFINIGIIWCYTVNRKKETSITIILLGLYFHDIRLQKVNHTSFIVSAISGCYGDDQESK